MDQREFPYVYNFCSDQTYLMIENLIPPTPLLIPNITVYHKINPSPFSVDYRALHGSTKLVFLPTGR